MRRTLGEERGHLMISLPHDTADVFLAPVALALDQQLQQLSELNQAEIFCLITLATDREPRTSRGKRDLLLETLTRDISTHDWTVSWDPRGLRVEHDLHRVVLGLPESVRIFLDPVDRT